jgi:hypothetical protein
LKSSFNLIDDKLTAESSIICHPTPPSTSLTQRRLSARTVERIRQLTIASKESTPAVVEDPSAREVTPPTEEVDHETQGEIPKLLVVDEMSTIRTLQQKSRLRKAESSQSSDIISDESPSREAWKQYVTKNDSIITEIFGGQLQSSIECLTCHHKSFCFDPFLDLSLPIGAGSSKCTVESCLECFSGSALELYLVLLISAASEFLDGDNAYFCEKCNKKQKGVKTLNISRCPQILVWILSGIIFLTFNRSFILSGFDTPRFEEKRCLLMWTSLCQIWISRHIYHQSFPAYGLRVV